VLALAGLLAAGAKAGEPRHPVADHRPPDADASSAVPRQASGPPPVPAPATLWHVRGEGKGEPAVDGSAVYFLSRRHEIVAVEARSGDVRWRNHTGEPGDETAGSVVVRAGDLVIAGDYNLVAFDSGNGAMRWRFQPPDGYGAGYYLGGAAGDLVFTGSPSGRLYAVDIRTGRARWSTLVAGGGASTVFAPITDGDVVVAGYTAFLAPNVGGVVAVDAETGSLRWQSPFPPSPGGVLSTRSAGGPLIYGRFVLATGATGIIHAFDRSDGSLQWSIAALDVPPPFGPTAQDHRPLARTGDTLFAGSLFGVVVAYDLRTRSELWRYGSLNEGSVNFRITSDDTAVYIPYLAGRLVALRVEDGRVRWRMPDGSAGFEWPASSLDDRVYAAASEGGFFAFRR
jgi:outer membrane protein assembly factor BamB